MNKIYSMKCFLFIGTLALFFVSCSDDNEVNAPESPTIEFSSSEYKVKVGKQITLNASVNNAVNPIYSWKLDGIIVATNTIFTYDAEVTGEYFFTFRVDADNGSPEEQVKVTVSNKMSPEITIPTSFGGYVNENLEIKPTSVLNGDDASYLWKLDGEVISTENTCTVNKESVGSYTLSLQVTNEDGIDYTAITIYLLPVQTPSVFFDNGSYRTETSKSEIRSFTVPLGRSLMMAPVLANMGEDVTFSWTIDGVTQSSTSEYLSFTPAKKETHTISVTANDGTSTASTTTTIECVAEEGTYYRQATDESAAKMNHVYEFVPAPGQFINYQKGTTMEGVLNHLNSSNSVAYIGAYGGYFIVGFDHSVDNSEGADLAIDGNAFESWSEPGIVWVMQDENGDGLPNDTWYELAGSEAESSATKKRYAITYYKPDSPQQNVLWSDNMGNISSVDYNGYHSQDYYFPMFIEEDAYTLIGTRLGSTMEIGDLETCAGYDWGYVDNYGSGAPENSLFEIDNAIQVDGSPIKLQYIDFVKVHTAMIGKGTLVGEISCEAESPYDYHLKE